MTDPDEVRELAERLARCEAARQRHDTNLEIIGVLLVLEGEAHPGRWRAGRPGGDGTELVQDNGGGSHLFPLSTCADGHHGQMIAADVALVAALRNGAREALLARRRMLERHRPDPEYTGRVIDCASCFDAQESPLPWPCPNYLDAEAGLVMPHRVTVTLAPGAQLAAAACDCCGWSKTISYARPVTGAPVAERLAATWGARHLAGDPAAQLGAAEVAHAHTFGVRCPVPGCSWPLAI